MIAEAGITAAGASPTCRSTTSVAVAPSGSGRGVDRLQAGAKGSRLRRRLRRQFPQHDLERLLGRACEPRLVTRRLEYREVILGHVGHDLGLAFVGDRDDRLPFGHDLSDLEAHGGDDTALRRAQHRVLQPIACKLELPRLGLGRGRSRLRTALRLLVVGYAHRAVALQRVEPVPIRLGLPRLRRGGDELLPRRFLGQPVIGVVEHRQHVALAHFLADVDLALHDLAADAKCLVDFVARLHRADVAVRFLRLVVADLGGAHGAKGFRGWLRCARGQDGDGDHRDDDQCGGERRIHGGSSYRATEFHDVGEFGLADAAGSATGSNACQPPPSALYSCTLSSSSCVFASFAETRTTSRTR